MDPDSCLIPVNSICPFHPACILPAEMRMRVKQPYQRMCSTLHNTDSRRIEKQAACRLEGYVENGCQQYLDRPDKTDKYNAELNLQIALHIHRKFSETSLFQRVAAYSPKGRRYVRVVDGKAGATSQNATYGCRSFSCSAANARISKGKLRPSEHK
jgi:hypothetical protein